MRKHPLGTWILYAITILGLCYLMVPLVTIAIFTFNEPAGKFNTSWQSFTWDNWRNAFDRTDYFDAFIKSIQVAAIACTIATFIGALMSLAISRYKMRGGAAINLLLVLPLTTPEIVMGASLFTLFFNQDVDRGFGTIVIAHTLFCVSFVALTVKARLRGLDWSLEDAAADLGSPPIRTFYKITMPMIAPGIAAAFMLSVALSIDDYIITSFVAGSVSTFPREVFDSSRVEIPPQVHVIATITMVVAILVIVLSTVAGYRRERRLARQTAAPVLPPPPASLQS
jgi:spermidine/putrescine transport system permease protein